MNSQIAFGLGLVVLNLAACSGASDPGLFGSSDGNDGRTDGGSTCRNCGSDAGSSGSRSKDGGVVASSDASTPTTGPTSVSSSNVKRVFVTSSTYPANFGSLTNADTLCQTAANSQSLGGAWTAWLSDNGEDAYARLADVGPWYLVDGVTEVWSSVGAIFDEDYPHHEIDRDESGATPPWWIAGGDGAWSGSGKRGVRDYYNCGNWTTTGTDDIAEIASNDASEDWGGEKRGALCNESHPLICFEQ